MRGVVIRMAVTALLACLLVGGAGRTTTEAKEGGRRPMSSEKLAEMIKKGDASAAETARQIGPAAVEVAEPFLRDPNREVRLKAVDSIRAAGGPKAPELLIRALGDSDEQVRINAVNGLQQNLPNGREKLLLSVWDETKDPFLRQQIPRVIGRLESRDAIPPLKKRLAGFEEGRIHDGLIAALSKLGDEESRARFAVLLQEARGERVAEMMGYVEYIDDPWLLPYLRPVMDRKEPALVIGTHVKTVIRRGCDLATDEVIRISGAKFSFAPDPGAQYTDEQLAEIKRYLERLNPARKGG
jgi:hypothetical protein